MPLLSWTKSHPRKTKKKPREFWIVEAKNIPNYYVCSTPEVAMCVSNFCSAVVEVIHVREVEKRVRK